MDGIFGTIVSQFCIIFYSSSVEKFCGMDRNQGMYDQLYTEVLLQLQHSVVAHRQIGGCSSSLMSGFDALNNADRHQLICSNGLTRLNEKERS